jgi:cytoskeletal protein RodZ
MSVFLENHRRGSDYDTSSPRSGSKRPSKPRRGDDAPLWGFSYDRAEGVIHLLLAFTMVGGAAAMLWTLLVAPEPKVAEKPAAPAKAAMASAPAEARAAAEKPPAPIVKTESRAEPAQIATPVPTSVPAPAPVAAPAMAAAMSPISIADAPAPLAPPPADVRARLAAPVDTPARPVVTTRVTDSEAPTAEAATPQKSEDAPAQASASEGDRSRTAHCYLKLAGRVQANASCQVQITENGIIFQLPGKPLAIEHVRGRTWAATLGGRSLGNVYKSGSCWGAHGFYACKNG